MYLANMGKSEARDSEVRDIVNANVEAVLHEQGLNYNQLGEMVGVDSVELYSRLPEVVYVVAVAHALRTPFARLVGGL